MMYLLVDCNQFFVSCEQLFNPRLMGQPVVVLSSNDGCVVSRSKEAKALGIPMGAPAYQYAELFKTHGVHVFSSNFALYSDMSRRVMQVLHALCPEVEEYSVDEAFLTGEPEDAAHIHSTVLKWTGIPVSIGVAPTKTLAKVASDLAKKEPSGILALTDAASIDAVLSKLPAAEVWGVGRRLSEALKEAGIRTALQLKNADELWLRKRFSVVLVRTVLELRGQSCLSLEEVPEVRKSLTCSRSFGQRVTELSALEEAVASYVASAAKKLREEELSTSMLTVFITTSPFLKSDYYANALTVTLPEPTTYTPLLISAAKKALGLIYRSGFQYKKAGIILGEFSSAHLYQADLFDSENVAARAKKNRAMQLIDAVNRASEKPRLQFAAEGLEKRWKAHHDNCSQRFTTRWSEILTIKI